MKKYVLTEHSIIRAPAGLAHQLPRVQLRKIEAESIEEALSSAAAAVEAELSQGDAIDRIALASPAFAARLRSALAGDGLEEKQARGAWRYLTRATSRPTPFGAFAGYSVLKSGGGSDGLDFGEFEERFHVRNDAREPVGIETDKVPLDGIYRVAPLFYEALGRFRVYEPYDKNNSTSLRLSEINCDAALYKFLVDLPENFSRGYFISHMMAMNMAQDQQEAEDAIDELERNGLLALAVPRGEGLCVAASSMKQVMALSKPSDSERSDLRVDLEFVGSGAVPSHNIKVLEDNLDWIVPIFGYRNRSERLVGFARELYGRFSNEPIPLLLALDADWVGYGKWSDETRRFLGLVPKVRIPAKSSVLNLAGALLSNHLAGERTIELDTNLLREIAARSIQTNLAALWALYTSLSPEAGKELVWLHSLGGGSGLRLIGRFIGQSQSMDRVISALAQNDSRHHGDAVCAEVMVSPTTALDNVLPVSSAYFRVISLDGKTEYSSMREISLRDLCVRAAGDTVRMTLGRDGPEVVPRFSSALVHDRTGSPIQRFLADLSLEYSMSSLDFWSLAGASPDRRPRVVAGGIIISPESWTFSEKEAANIRNERQRVSRWRKIDEAINKMNVSDIFGLHEGDNVMTLERSSPYAYAEIEARLLKRTPVHLSEAPLLHAASNVCRRGKPIAHQMVSFFSSPLEAKQTGHVKIKSNDIVAPRPEWIYLKTNVRCGSESKVMTAFAKLADSVNAPWFFVRYPDADYQLRIRILIGERPDGRRLASSTMEQLMLSGDITSWSEDLYFPEALRYGGEPGLELAHAVAYASSVYTLAVNDQVKFSERETLIAAFFSSVALVTALCVDEAIARDVIDTQLEAFSSERGISRVGEFSRLLAKELGPIARELQLGTVPKWLAEPLDRLRAQLRRIQSSHNPPARGEPIKAMLHMHFNRQFDDDPRGYELICWVLLSRFKASPKFRALWPAQQNELRAFQQETVPR